MGERYQSSYGYNPTKTYTWDEMCTLLKQDMEARKAYNQDNTVRLEYLNSKGNWEESNSACAGEKLANSLFYKAAPKVPLKNLSWLNGMTIAPKNGTCHRRITDANETHVVIDGKMQNARYLFEFYQFESGRVIGE